ncbi:MAG: Histidyl-tRNA synthetase [uncultured Chloroflexi bacterium]|uniref:Histidine--tRNA ligase n=1 Tax=uncultured Chloroflexota bacterium TaxID=166587 RepID=A0A6J4HRI9_9CHLR|nr:MAG: Histidyl-tRNA synthetase [uncultured Chloroflexota bacterium]
MAEKEQRIQPRTLKGFNDYLPEQALRRQVVQERLRHVFERWGYQPLETPTLEYADVLLGRYGAEAEKLIYRFTDNGGRDVALRYDQTVPFARVVAQYGEKLARPFRRYQFQRVWRGENTGRGREREFTQCDVDVAGAASPVVDAETLVIAAEGYRAIGFPRVQVLVNDRTLFDDLGISKEEVISIDKLDKIGAEGVIRELVERGREEAAATDLLSRLQSAEPPARLKDVLAMAEDFGMPEGVLQFEPTLARGLEYYTSTILEVRSPDYTAGSIGGGGRYDALIRRFTGRDVPAVGFSFGLERVIEALEAVGAFSGMRAAPAAVAIALGRAQLRWAGDVAARLRAAGVSVAMATDPDGGAGKQLGAAGKLGARYALLVGESEAAAQQVALKDLESGQQETLGLDEVVQRLTATVP